jgi:hypothetical protein
VPKHALSPALDGFAVSLAHCFISSNATSIHTLTGRPTEGPDATPECGDVLPPKNCSRVYNTQGDDPLKEVPNVRALAICPARERVGPTLTVMFETMTATQGYAVATSYMNSWETECIPTLPTAFFALQYLGGRYHMLGVAIKALAAYQLCRESSRNSQSTTHEKQLCPVQRLTFNTRLLRINSTE